MKKYGLRVLVGLIAFVIGVSAVIFIFKQSINSFFVMRKTTPVFTSEADHSGKVEIYYKGFFKNENGIINVEFEVINGTSNKIYYQGLTKSFNSFFTVSSNGKEGKFGRNCGFVILNKEDFVIESSETVRFKLGLDRFGEFSPKQKRQDFRVGFDLKFEGKEKYETIWSNDFQLPESVQKKLQKY